MPKEVVVLYNPQLDAFLAVSRAGSFTKAAQELFVSSTAVMKQINALENHLELKLFERSFSGVSLTPAGKMLLKDAEFIKAYSEKAVAAARAASQTGDKTFCVGTSLLNPAKPFMDLWYDISAEFADYKLHLVPFEDNHEGILSEIKLLGEKFDFLIGVCDSKRWLSLCSFLPLGRYKKMIAVSRDDPLAKKEILNLEDLHGRTLMMVGPGDSALNDFLRNDLETNHPQIKLESTPRFYDLSVFNRCAETNNLLLTIECWKDVHGALVTLPVNWSYSIPYGLLYSNDAPADVLAFVEAARKFVEGE